MKILLVDDNPKVRDMVKELAGNSANIFYEASNGTEAVSLYKQHQPDIVVMDIEMEKMDGLIATRMIYDYDAKANVIVLTNHSDPFFREAALRAGSHIFIEKNNMLSIRSLLCN